MSAQEWQAWPGEWKEYGIRLRAQSYEEARAEARSYFGEHEAEAIHVVRVTPDMRLAEAAPELLEALEAVMRHVARELPNAAPEAPGQECVGDMAFRCIWCRARAAIAKARGES